MERITKKMVVMNGMCWGEEYVCSPERWWVSSSIHSWWCIHGITILHDHHDQLIIQKLLITKLFSHWSVSLEQCLPLANDSFYWYNGFLSWLNVYLVFTIFFFLKHFSGSIVFIWNILHVLLLTIYNYGFGLSWYWIIVTSMLMLSPLLLPKLPTPWLPKPANIHLDGN